LDSTPDKHRPNVVFVLTDDQGYGDLSCHGNPILRTPCLNSLYSDSVRLTQFHVGPTCAPTRAGLMTGHFANSTGVWHTIGGRSLLREDEWSLASAFKEAGYRTALFGKWHLGDAYPYRPQDRGFETTVIHGGGGISQTPDYWGNDYFDDTYRADGESRPFEGYCTDVWFREAMAYIKAHREEPFFCAITTNAPHSPYNVPTSYRVPYMDCCPDERTRFYGMIANIDENVGKLWNHLRREGLEEETILIFMTDNGSSGGASLDQNGFVREGYNAGMRGIKGSPYDGGHRVPFFLRWPAAGLAGGRDVPQLASHVDFMPTLLDLCGIPAGDHTFHGLSLKPLLFEERDSEWPGRALVTDSQRLVLPVKWRQSATMTDRWRLINGSELYDLSVDPGQKRDVSRKHRNVVRRLRDSYEKWWDGVTLRANEEIPFPLGGVCGTTRLTCHDWRNDDCHCPWNQSHIRAGLQANGYWEVNVLDAGEYTVELRRWPEETGRGVTEGVVGDDVTWRSEWISRKDWSHYSGGEALPVTRARLKIGEVEEECPVDPKVPCVTFSVNLKKGPAHLWTCFSDEKGGELGAYYVRVSKAFL